MIIINYKFKKRNTKFPKTINLIEFFDGEDYHYKKNNEEVGQDHFMYLFKYLIDSDKYKYFVSKEVI